jgi:hypothetical protein
MIRFFPIFVIIILSCSSKKSQPEEKKGFSTIKLYIKPDIELESKDVIKDLEILKKRLSGTGVFKSLKVSNKEPMFFTFNVSNYGKNRRFLNRFKKLLKFRGIIELRPILDYPEDLLNSKKPKPIHKISTFGVTVFRSASRYTLLNFIKEKKINKGKWFIQRIPKGVQDFPKSNWASYLTGNPLEFKFDNSNNIIISDDSPVKAKSFALILDSSIIKFFINSGNKKIPIENIAGRFTHKQIELIIKNGVLSASWRISRIEASQEM